MTVAADSMVSDAEIVDELRAAWAEVSRGYARCSALTFTTRRADYELGCAQTLLDRLPLVHAALATGELDHHKARVFTDYLAQATPAQAERICARLVPRAAGWTTGQLAARLLREVQAIDPNYTREAYQRAVRTRGVHGYLDHTGTAVLTGSGLPAAEAAAAAARLETLADDLRAAGYPATLHQTRADLFLRLLDGTLDGHTHPQILTTMLSLGPLAPADTDPSHRPSERDHQPPQRLLDVLRTVATRHDCTPSQVALAWVLAKGPDVVPIPGTKRQRYLTENLGALAVELTPAEITELDTLRPAGDRAANAGETNRTTAAR